jgi:hypothetical protein
VVPVPGTGTGTYYRSLKATGTVPVDTGDNRRNEGIIEGRNESSSSSSS